MLNFYPDFLWFSSFGFASIWWIELVSRLQLFAFCLVILLASVWINIGIGALIGKRFATQTFVVQTRFPLLNTILYQWQPQLARISQKAEWGIGGFLSVVAVLLAWSFSASWQLVKLGSMSEVWGVSDPIFKHDLGFYALTWPALEWLQSFFLFALFLAWVASIGIYFVKNTIPILLNMSGLYTYVGLRRHLSVLVAGVIGMIAFGVFLSQFGLLLSDHHLIFGANYVDVTVKVVVLRILTGALGILAISILVWGWTKVPGKSVVICFFVVVAIWVLGLGLLPSTVQTYSVAPNELVREKPYLKHTIFFTRLAYELDRIQESSFPAKNNLSKETIQRNPHVMKNIRLWNEEPLKQTFRQLQEIRPYYEFNHIDVDRYLVQGQKQQVLLSPREIDISQLPRQAQTWTNTHLIYTHGFGVCMSPVNQFTSDGLPLFFIKDIPSSFENWPYSLPLLRIYFGENTNHYAIVNTKQPEFDYPKGDSNEYLANNTFSKGVVLDSALKRLVYAFKFSDINILISSQLTPQSKLLYNRNIKQMVTTLAPYLVLDKDPYSVITSKGLFWIVDAYTVSDRMPYSEPFGGLNYIRNSVKITINAETGEINFYSVYPERDVLIRAYSKLYPNVYKPLNTMPSELKEHIRYPKGLFSIQAQLYATFHMTDPQVFYNREDVWQLSKKGSDENKELLEPYYMVIKMNQDIDTSFVLMVPFTPMNKNNMIGWMGADCDIEDYGRITVYKFPKDRTVYGPAQVESRIDQDTEISKLLTLWGQVGSQVVKGDLLVIPVEESLLYIQPIFLQSTSGRLPELKRVITVANEVIVMSETLEDSLQEVFGEAQTKTNKTQTTDSLSLKTLLEQLKQNYLALKQSSSWKQWGEKLDKLGETIEAVKQKAH